MVNRPQLLLALAVALAVLGFVMFALGRLLVAGVCFLSLSLTLYLRGTYQ